jgi:hypothetical protein
MIKIFVSVIDMQGVFHEIGTECVIIIYVNSRPKPLIDIFHCMLVIATDLLP